METGIKKERKKVQIQQQILHIMINIVEAYPQYTFSQHLAHAVRKKSELTDAYFWSDETLLKKFEDYYDELRNELNEDNG